MEALNLSAEELATVDSVLSALSARAKFTITLGSVLQKWGKLVAKVERGYDDSIYEYTNDLAIRDTIQKVLSGVPRPLNLKLAALVKADDGRFFQATREINRALIDGKNIEEQPWWFRIPRRPSKELEVDLRSMGFPEEQ